MTLLKIFIDALILSSLAGYVIADLTNELLVVTRNRKRFWITNLVIALVGTALIQLIFL